MEYTTEQRKIQKRQSENGEPVTVLFATPHVEYSIPAPPDAAAEKLRQLCDEYLDNVNADCLPFCVSESDVERRVEELEIEIKKLGGQLPPT